MTDWFLKKEDGQIYGPVSQDRLIAWAGDGRVSPEDEISEDQEHWRTAPALPELHMEWQVELENGDMYGPIHLASLKDLFDEGATDLISNVVNKQNDETYSVAQLLIAYLENQLQLIQTAPEADLPDAAEPHSKSHPAEKDLEKKNAELLSARARIAELEKQLKQAVSKEKISRRDPSGVQQQGAKNPEAILTSYQDLKKQYDRLAAQLHEKTKAVENTEALYREHKAYTEERLEKLESLNKRHETRAETAEKQLRTLEETHHELLRSYREINDRHIQLLQQTRKPQDEADTDSEWDDDEPPPQRLRMTRDD